MSSRRTDITYEDVNDIDTVLLTLRKPTELKKVIDSVPKPIRAVPKNGLPMWYKIGLECKLPVPKMPAGRIIFSRGRIGEDIRRIGLGGTGPSPNFDLTDPYCNNVSYDYVPMHDPHLSHHFSQKSARNRMKALGFCTKDDRAVCSLKEFNQYRKYLYNRFMDRIHMEMKKIDERERDDLTLKRVDVDVARRQLIFTKVEKAREHMEKVTQLHADEWAEKKRAAKEQEKKIQARMNYLAEYNEKMRKERAARSFEKENRIKQRVQAAAEMELRRKITMVRQWRTNEKRRLSRLKHERDSKQKRMEDEANQKWTARVNAQNQKIQEEAVILKLYTDDMAAGARRRAKKADIYAYNTDLELQRIRLANWKIIHGVHLKTAKLVKKMGEEFERSKRGAKGMSPALAQVMAKEAMSNALSNQGDALMTLGQARAQMDIETVLPSPPVKILEQIVETVIMEFTRRRVHTMLLNIEHIVYERAGEQFFKGFRPTHKKPRSKTPRWAQQGGYEMTHRSNVRASRCGAIAFGDIIKISDEDPIDYVPKSIKNRPPTPVPSRTRLAEVTFSDKIEDLVDAVALGSYLPERKKILDMVHIAARIVLRNVQQEVVRLMDPIIGKVTLPKMRRPMEWGEAVEGLAQAVVDEKVQHSDCGDVRRVSVFLTHRVLKSMQHELKIMKRERKNTSLEPEATDFYIPGSETVYSPESPSVTQPPE